MVISSPVVTLVNPASVVAAAADPIDSTRVDSSNYHSTPRIPDTPSTSIPATARAPSSSSSTLNQGSGGGDFTAQAPLSPPASYLSNDLVGSNTIYELVFVPTTTGIIKKVEMTFPAGTGISAVGILDRIGIGGGTLSKAGTTVTFTVNNAVSVPAGTFIRLELVNVKSPLSPSSAYQVTVTTRDPANGVIDGPTPSTAYNIRRIGSNDIADNAVTTTHIAPGAVTSGDIADGAVTSEKIASTFAYQRTIGDGSNGWTPDGATSTFIVTDPLITNSFQRVLINLGTPAFGGPVCSVTFINFGNMEVSCSSAPADGTELRYVVFNAPGS
jgi:hypothetical protein